MNSQATRTHCIRCGECCLRSSPTLHRVDLGLMDRGCLERELPYTFHLRPFLSRKLGLRAEEMDFFFGRPLTETIVTFGLKVERQPDGGFLLTTLNKHGAME